ncbi:hypothetical protein BV898_17581 [Hypsibius exemplaris]|uniref:Uncharacterized protein n=1 Tax=Hypsibius exemplaris TaxID=2072580 RepID=A0A9X6NIA4_HYPEX|nr:hypothetical protein BV898_17581 [Hypsibius exemplaris]
MCTRSSGNLILPVQQTPKTTKRIDEVGKKRPSRPQSKRQKTQARSVLEQLLHEQKKATRLSTSIQLRLDAELSRQLHVAPPPRSRSTSRQHKPIDRPNRQRRDDVFDRLGTKTGTTSDSKNREVVTSFAQWTRGFYVFIAHRSHHYDFLRVPLLNYLNVVAQLAERLPLSQWVAYDALHRLRAAVRPDDISIWSDQIPSLLYGCTIKPSSKSQAGTTSHGYIMIFYYPAFMKRFHSIIALVLLPPLLSKMSLSHLLVFAQKRMGHIESFSTYLAPQATVSMTRPVPIPIPSNSVVLMMQSVSLSVPASAP